MEEKAEKLALEIGNYLWKHPEVMSDNYTVDLILQFAKNVVEDACPDIIHDDYIICGKCGSVI